MRVNLLVGMIVGGAIGAAATMVAMPYIQPRMNRMIRQGRRAINSHMDKMTEQGS
jgi:gas vesicle protein